jgi:hypothetical protein
MRQLESEELGARGTYTTARTLLSILRLAQSLAALRFDRCAALWSPRASTGIRSLGCVLVGCVFVQHSLMQTQLGPACKASEVYFPAAATTTPVLLLHLAPRMSAGIKMKQWRLLCPFRSHICTCTPRRLYGQLERWAASLRGAPSPTNSGITGFSARRAAVDTRSCSYVAATTTCLSVVLSSAGG